MINSGYPFDSTITLLEIAAFLETISRMLVSDVQPDWSARPPPVSSMPLTNRPKPTTSFQSPLPSGNGTEGEG